MSTSLDTEQIARRTCDHAADVVSGGERTTRGIKIMPDMVKAGALELSTYNSEFEDMHDAVQRIFWAMIDVVGRSRH